MGILSRFSLLMKANINHLIDRAENPEKAIKDTLRKTNLELGTIKSETNAHEAEVRRLQHQLHECEADITKMERYSKKAEENQEKLKAVQFREQKETLEKNREKLIKAYNEAQLKAKQISLLEEKLTLDLSQLEKRYAILKEKSSSLKQQKLMNEFNSSSTPSPFDDYEEQLKFKLDEANALAELRGYPNVLNSEEKSIDEEIAALKFKNNDDVQS